MSSDRPICAICKKPIERGEGRIRRGLASVHVECAKREDETRKRKRGHPGWRSL